jgi:hypothetical protein
MNLKMHSCKVKEHVSHLRKLLKGKPHSNTPVEEIKQHKSSADATTHHNLGERQSQDHICG